MVDPQRSAARERTATETVGPVVKVVPHPSTKCSSRTNCDRARRSRPHPTRRVALNEVQLANELRLEVVVDARLEAPAPSTKCSSRTNCDRLHRTRLPLSQRPSTKCSSRTNCDRATATFALKDDGSPQRSAARERTATARPRSGRTGGPSPSTKCSSRTNCDTRALIASAPSAIGTLNEVQLANELRQPVQVRLARQCLRVPSTKCSSRTNCDRRKTDDVRKHSRPSTKCSSRTNCDPLTQNRSGRGDAPQRSAARERTATSSRSAASRRLMSPQRSAARERTATRPSSSRTARRSRTLNEVQLANELRRPSSSEK